MSANVMRTMLNRRVLIAAGVIGAASLFLPLVRGYGTILFQFVVLGAWGAAGHCGTQSRI